MIDGRDIVILCGMHFHDEYWTSKQHIARRLVRNNRVLFVERRPWARQWRLWISLLRGGVREDGRNLYLLPALYLLPGNYRWGAVNRINQWIVRAFIRRAVKSLGLRNPLVWSFVHDVDLRGLGSQTIYHCVDNWREFPRWSSSLAARREEDAARGASVVFASAAPLADRLRALNPRVHYFPNAVDLDNFSRPGAAMAVPPDLERVPAPRICYMGTLEAWFDTETLLEVARRRAGWSFVFFGSMGKNFTGHRLLSLPNVHYLGLKKREDLAAYLHACDVCLIPFTVNDLTISVSPLKLFEYFACGKPVVSSNLPEVARFSPLVRIAAGVPAYEAAIQDALADGPEMARRRMDEAQAHSWKRRVEEYSRVIEALGPPA